ncbi:MAG: hypothetical protein A2W31_18865 [Planctomycetes bacterium RBG_16_64_10]|nr:MAG: hypothetical protein A2W31_18865 [Planctomycetes bacterium RBG_16_64_10]
MRPSEQTPGFSIGSDLPELPVDPSLGREPSVRQLPVVLASGGGLEGRGAGLRGQLVDAYGGSQASQAAVARGLRWLMAHQLDDGSWRFDLRQSPQCRGQCRHHGTIGSSTAATALALLPFLGAGQTHRDGEYQEVVKKGLYYLERRMIATPRGGDLQEGTMYAQGLATIALCEACAMTGDDALRATAQSAIEFIVAAQHPRGGWRYVPGQPGDTTVTGWQVMALKSGQLAGFEIPLPTWYAVARFLDSVQADDGSYYGYLVPEKRPTTTAIGLLCRMYLGWPRAHSPLLQGVEYLSKTGPSPNDMYFNFYAAQVLHHFGGPVWDRWNGQLRDGLIAAQASAGHEAGSWQFVESHSREAGRLYNTAMAIMLLEIYYRYMPLYSQRTFGAPP